MQGLIKLKVTQLIDYPYLIFLTQIDATSNVRVELTFWMRDFAMFVLLNVCSRINCRYVYLVNLALGNRSPKTGTEVTESTFKYPVLAEIVCNVFSLFITARVAKRAKVIIS